MRSRRTGVSRLRQRQHHNSHLKDNGYSKADGISLVEAKRHLQTTLSWCTQPGGAEQAERRSTCRRPQLSCLGLVNLFFSPCAM